MLNSINDRKWIEIENNLFVFVVFGFDNDFWSVVIDRSDAMELVLFDRSASNQTFVDVLGTQVGDILFDGDDVAGRRNSVVCDIRLKVEVDGSFGTLEDHFFGIVRKC
jgi:hypothetical protein